MTAKSRESARPGRMRASDYRLLAEFRHHLRKFTAFSEEAAREAGLSPQQHQALLAIKGFGGGKAPTVGDLAKCLSIRHHSAVGLVDRLVEARLIVRYFDAEDRRRVALVPSRRAEELLTDLGAAHRDELRRIAPMLRSILASLEA